MGWCGIQEDFRSPGFRLGIEDCGDENDSVLAVPYNWNNGMKTKKHEHVLGSESCSVSFLHGGGATFVLFFSFLGKEKERGKGLSIVSFYGRLSHFLHIKKAGRWDFYSGEKTKQQS